MGRFQNQNLGNGYNRDSPGARVLVTTTDLLSMSGVVAQVELHLRGGDHSTSRAGPKTSCRVTAVCGRVVYCWKMQDWLRQTRRPGHRGITAHYGPTLGDFSQGRRACVSVHGHLAGNTASGVAIYSRSGNRPISGIAGELKPQEI